MRESKFLGEYVRVILEHHKTSGTTRERVYLRDSVHVLIVDDAKYLYLLKEKRWELKGKKTVHLISGIIEKDESPIKAAKRELEEEADITACTLRKVLTHNQKGTVNQRKHYYVATLHKQAKVDNSLLCKYSLRDLKRLILQGFFGPTTSGSLINFLARLDSIRGR